MRHLVEDGRQVLLQGSVVQIKERTVGPTVAARRADSQKGLHGQQDG